jgi:hypothetical protein
MKPHIQKVRELVQEWARPISARLKQVSPTASASPALPKDSAAATAITDMRIGRTLDAPIKNLSGARESKAYDAVIDQFGVDGNPRYAPRVLPYSTKTQTFCNVFVTDVMAAMGVILPHWVDARGNPAQPAAPGSVELNANGTVNWLNTHGHRYGWNRITDTQAQEHANSGHPVIAGQSPLGHVAVVRPGTLTAKGPAIAQAGAQTTNKTTVGSIFVNGHKDKLVQYWVNLK